MGEFTAQAETDKICKLADQALNQHTKEGEDLATSLLYAEVLTLSGQQIREVAKLAEESHKKAGDEWSKANNEFNNTPLGPAKVAASLRDDAAANKYRHTPTLELVEADNKVYGITFAEYGTPTRYKFVGANPENRDKK